MRSSAVGTTPSLSGSGRSLGVQSSISLIRTRTASWTSGCCWLRRVIMHPGRSIGGVRIGWMLLACVYWVWRGAGKTLLRRFSVVKSRLIGRSWKRYDFRSKWIPYRSRLSALPYTLNSYCRIPLTRTAVSPSLVCVASVVAWL